MGCSLLKKVLLAIHQKIISVYVIVAVFILWQALPSAGLVNSHFFPPFSEVVAESFNLGWGNIITDIVTSLRRVIIGFFVATAVALPFGFILAGALPRLARLLNPLMVFLSQIPPFILFPVFVIIFGIGEGGIFTVIFWSSVWPVLFSTITGTQLVDPVLVKCARSMNSNPAIIFFKVILPGALPSIMTGLRSGMTFCFMMLIGAETMGASSGLGWQINMAQRMAVVPRIYLAALIAAIVGLAINYLIEWFERNTIVWKEDADQGMITAD